MTLIIVAFLLLLFVLECCYGGHEVLYQRFLRENDLKDNEIALVQFDNRVLSDYWNASAYWNQFYAKKYGHQYAYLTSSKPCQYASFKLAPAWCKVKAMALAEKVFPTARAFLYIDSDAIMTVNYSLSTIMSFVRQDLNWSYIDTPFAFNQDGPGWACKYTARLGYDHCLNSGTVFWIRNPISTQILHEWWHSAGDPYDSSPFTTKWRDRWPWEQAQMYKVYQKYKDRIMVLSFPNLLHLPWTSTKNPKSQYPTDTVEPWCFSHWPGANCFITHHCASKPQKKKLIEQYVVSDVDIHVSPISIDDMKID